MQAQALSPAPATSPSTPPPANDASLRLPENASLFTRLRLAFRALMILKDQPDHVEAGQLVNASLDYGAYQPLIRALRATPDGTRLLDERPSLQGPDLDLAALAALPEGTLGHETARYFRDNGIQPFTTTLELRSDVDYVAKRYRETHDLYHVVTGYKTDVPGEMELQAFAMGNLGIRSPMMILTFGFFITATQRRHGVGPVSYIRRVRQALRRGRHTRRFLDFPFERHWTSTVDEVRRLMLAGAATAA